MTKKNIISLLLLLLLLIAMGGGVYLVRRQQTLSIRAAPATTIYFEPSVALAKPEETVNLDILLDTGENYLATLRLDITYDFTVLQPLSLTFNSTLLSQPLRAADLSQPGRISGSAGVPPGSPIHGASQKAASVSFRTLKEAAMGTAIDFGAETSAYSATQDEPAGSDLIARRTPATVVIESAAVPTPTSFPSPSPSPTPSSSPGRGGGEASPSPTSTPLPKEILTVGA